MEHEVYSLVERVLDRRLPAGAGIAVALSGGADSVALLCACGEYGARHGVKVVALHCNFHLRGKESDADADFCRAMARQLGIGIEVADFDDVPARMKATGESLEMVCRRLRYDWFDGYIKQGFFIALGHHIEDNRETFFLNLVRGTGLRGLCGMEEADPERRLLRPLIRSTRRQIEDYLQTWGVAWRTDSSNLVADVQRNRLRLNVLPTLESNFPTGLQGIDRSMENLRDDYGCLREWLDDMCRRVVDGNRIDLALLRSLTRHPHRVLLEILRPRGFSSTQVHDILGLKPSAGYGLFAGADCNVEANYNEARIVEADSAAPVVLRGADVLTLSSLEGGPKVEEIATDRPLDEVRKRMRGCREGSVALFDADALDAACEARGGLVWRGVAHGDSLQPFGMGGRTKLASDILTNRHASPTQKRAARVLALGRGNTLLWLAPLRGSIHFPVTASTRRIYAFKL